eukprot:scaffold100790_cov30-Tisochrysis_lutea.AAC.3
MQPRGAAGAATVSRRATTVPRRQLLPKRSDIGATLSKSAGLAEGRTTVATFVVIHFPTVRPKSPMQTGGAARHRATLLPPQFRSLAPPWQGCEKTGERTICPGCLAPSGRAWSWREDDPIGRAGQGASRRVELGSCDP